MNCMLDGSVKHVLVEKLDRLSRHLVTQEVCIQDFPKKGMTIVSADPAEVDLMASDPSRVLVRQLFGAIAQYDKAMLVAKLKAGGCDKRAAGGCIGGNPPYGSRPGEVATIRRLKTLRAEGYAYQNRGHYERRRHYRPSWVMARHIR